MQIFTLNLIEGKRDFFKHRMRGEKEKQFTQEGNNFFFNLENL